MFNPFKWFFGSNDTTASVPLADNMLRTRARNKKKTSYSRSNVTAKNYYNRGGKFYSREDDCLIEDAVLLMILMDMFESGEMPEVAEDFAAEVEEDILDMDISGVEVLTSDYASKPVAETLSIVDTPAQVEIAQSTPEQSYSEPERTSSYSSGSYDSGSSDSGSYDSGSSDSGGGSDD